MVNIFFVIDLEQALDIYPHDHMRIPKFNHFGIIHHKSSAHGQLERAMLINIESLAKRARD